MVEIDSFAAGGLVDSSGSGDVAPPSDDLAKVGQRPIPPRQQVLHLLLPELGPSDGLVEHGSATNPRRQRDFLRVAPRGAERR